MQKNEKERSISEKPKKLKNLKWLFPNPRKKSKRPNWKRHFLKTQKKCLPNDHWSRRQRRNMENRNEKINSWLPIPPPLYNRFCDNPTSTYWLNGPQSNPVSSPTPPPSIEMPMSNVSNSYVGRVVPEYIALFPVETIFRAPKIKSIF